MQVNINEFFLITKNYQRCCRTICAKLEYNFVKKCDVQATALKNILNKRTTTNQNGFWTRMDRFSIHGSGPNDRGDYLNSYYTVRNVADETLLTSNVADNMHLLISASFSFIDAINCTHACCGINRISVGRRFYIQPILSVYYFAINKSQRSIIHRCAILGQRLPTFSLVVNLFKQKINCLRFCISTSTYNDELYKQ